MTRASIHHVGTTTTFPRRIAARAGLVALALGGCVAGVNNNESDAGAEHQGTAITYGDVAMHPSAGYFVATRGSAVVVGDPRTGACEVLPGLHDAGRVVFGKKLAFITSGAEDDAIELVGYDVAGRQPRWSLPLDGVPFDFRLDTVPLVAADEEAGTVVVAEATRVRIVAQHDGAVLAETSVPTGVVDVKAAGGAAIIVAHEQWGELITPVTVLRPRAEPVVIDVPNCAADLAVTPDGARAFLAPTTCGGSPGGPVFDPVSVIDVARGRFERNLPGFGPAGLTPDGKRVVAFMDADALDDDLFTDGDPRPEGDDRFHLMIIDPIDLGFELVPVGDGAPRFALGPDHRTALVDVPNGVAPLRTVDLVSGEVGEIAGRMQTLDQFTFIAGEPRLFAASRTRELYDVSLTDRSMSPVPLDFETLSVASTPDGRLLVLREGSGSWIPGTGALWTLEVDGAGEPQPICRSPELGLTW